MSEPDRLHPLPPGRWPFLDRERQAGRIADLLRTRQGRGVVLAGGAGVGKSRLAAEVVRAHGPVHRVVGTRCGASLPFSAFAGLRSPETDPGDPVRDLIAVLGGPPGQERRVLVVDDAHLLDRGSAALIHHLAVRRQVRLVVTVRDGEPAPDAVVALWKDDLLNRVEIPAMTHDDLGRLLEGALAGHVEARAVRRLAAIAEGDLRMIGELVRAGTLALRDGVWGWQGRPVVNGRVRELISNRLGDLSPIEWDALTYLAFGAPLSAGTLARLAGSRTVERLEARGLLTGSGDAPYAEIIRVMCGPVRASRVQRTLADRAHPRDALRAAVWRLEGGGPADPEVLTEGCRAALDALEVPLAARLGRAAVAAGGDDSAALTTALALQRPRTPGAAGGHDGAIGNDPLRALCAENRRLAAAVLAGDLTAEPMLGADAEWDIAAAAYCGQRARLYRLRGEVRRAMACGRDGAWRLPAGPAAFAGLCLGELAHAAALRGDVAAARAALTAARDRRLPAFRDLEISVELAGPWVEAAAGDRSAAVRCALAVADQSDDPELRAFALHSAVRLGAAERVAGRLRCLAGDHALVALFARHASACATADGGALDVVANEFEALGMTLYAAEAQAHAARAHRRAGEERRARAAVARGWTLSRLCQGARTPALTELAAPELTHRQLEIAQLAASGLSNRAIAERLTVSIRTVANHLCGAYERLGVNDRAGLAHLLSGLERRVA